LRQNTRCAFASQVEALKKYRSGGQQTIKVQHVTVNEGGQAIVRQRQGRPFFGAPRRRHGVLVEFEVLVWA